MSRILGFILAGAAAILTTACADPPNADPNQPNARASTIPWNRPESWEGQGQLGGMLQQQGGLPGQSR
jgi:outer membrane biogenesis lipoprotein LolB